MRLLSIVATSCVVGRILLIIIVGIESSRGLGVGGGVPVVGRHDCCVFFFLKLLVQVEALPLSKRPLLERKESNWMILPMIANMNEWMSLSSMI